MTWKVESIPGTTRARLIGPDGISQICENLAEAERKRAVREEMDRIVRIDETVRLLNPY